MLKFSYAESKLPGCFSGNFIHINHIKIHVITQKMQYLLTNGHLTFSRIFLSFDDVNYQMVACNLDLLNLRNTRNTHHKMIGEGNTRNHGIICVHQKIS